MGNQTPYKTENIFVMGIIKKETGKGWDRLEFNQSFTRNGKTVAVAVYENPDELPPPEVIAPYIDRDFRLAYQEMKWRLFEELKKLEETQNDTESD